MLLYSMGTMASPKQDLDSLQDSLLTTCTAMAAIKDRAWQYEYKAANQT